MSERAVTVVDTNVLLNLATPVVDGRPQAPSGAEPLEGHLTVYDVHAPASVLSEVTDATGNDELFAAAADIVLQAAQHLTMHKLEVHLFITDEFNTINYLFINLTLDDRNTLFTTPHKLCTLAIHEILPEEYVDAALTYYVETKDWDAQYVAQLRQPYLEK